MSEKASETPGLPGIPTSVQKYQGAPFSLECQWKPSEEPRLLFPSGSNKVLSLLCPATAVLEEVS